LTAGEYFFAQGLVHFNYKGVALSRLPVIIGFGGINSAGRSSFFHSYRRLVIDKLDRRDAADVYCGLATMMGYVTCKDGIFYDSDSVECSPDTIIERFGKKILENTLLRRISPRLWDMDRMYWHNRMTAKPVEDTAITMQVSKRMLPAHIPPHWEVTESDSDSSKVTITIRKNFEFLVKDEKKSLVQSGGQIPEGFDIAGLYRSNHHPRGLQLAIYGASDTVLSLGIDWEIIKNRVRPEEIGVYSCSAMGQLDSTACGGMMAAFALGKKSTSKQLAMALPEMPADFVNAYVLGNVGYTTANVGACATTLYNLNIAIKDIREGRRRVAFVGSSEAPLIPEVFEAYRVTSALAEDAEILELDKDKGFTKPDYSRSCRPFGYNCGFTLAEAAQYFVLCDDDLAVELGTQIFGAMGDVFINADGYKKSIASPGLGNYICLAKAVASARALFGAESVRYRSYIHAHGSGTQQNRSTESHGLNEIARAFGIEKWPVAAIKCFLGHSLGPASGDQIVAALGTWKYGFIPGIFTLDCIADDVYDSNLLLSKEHIETGPEGMDVAFINAKGFGGNNATGYVISPHNTMRMLQKKHGEETMAKYRKANETVVEKAQQYDRETIQGNIRAIYHFGTDVLSGDNVKITDQFIKIPGFAEPVNLNLSSPYPDLALGRD